ncbi:MAG: hypothetical protein GWM90_13260, partial [Gemmatimonadetes bacterium]|nr:hypothetical protein [Gemmatimonadota bacterium]NIQ55039.1 hypothetical protein [Gemmatimonadota bacterium]NIU75230.1 hypothetical protein [Gammaproteobacteria bacterium]NIX45043.1 hypothetical protein [Gemmatimonadota bacterium]NIY09276.1 hypothetical protein [Gemmatimonadota bacterium]
AVRYDLGNDATTLGGEIYPSNPTTRGSLVLGIGTDLGSGPVAVRLELMDIIGLSSPLARDDGTSYGAVQHVVFTIGLGFRAGHIDLRPRPEVATRPGRPPVRQPPTRRPRPVTEPRDSARAPEAEPETPVRPEPPRAPGMDTLTAGIPTRPVPGMDTLTVDVPARPVPGPAVGPGETPDAPDAPERPGDPEEIHGRLFTVRVVWDAAAATDTPAGVRLAAETLSAAGLPVWPAAPPEEDGRPSRRMGALRNAADARALGAFIQAEWDLAWTWVHIDRAEDVPASAVEASHDFVDGLAAPARPAKRKAAGGPPR